MPLSASTADLLPERPILQYTEWLRDAYLAGSAQTQADYTASC